MMMNENNYFDEKKEKLGYLDFDCSNRTLSTLIRRSIDKESLIHLNYEELKQIKGLGDVKIRELVASLEKEGYHNIIIPPTECRTNKEKLIQRKALQKKFLELLVRYSSLNVQKIVDDYIIKLLKMQVKKMHSTELQRKIEILEKMIREESKEYYY